MRARRGRSEYAYEGVRRVIYGDEGATFVPVCPQCYRFVKADTTMMLPVEGPIPDDVPNATCSQHGRVCMPCEGYIDYGPR